MQPFGIMFGVLFLVLPAFGQFNFSDITFARAAAASGGGSVTISDDFNRADAGTLGGNWTADAGVISISGNTAVAQTTGYSRIAQRYTATSLTTGASGYVRLTRVNSTTRYPQILFRCTGSGSACYSVEIQSSEDAVKWLYHSTTGANGTEIASSAATIIEYGTDGVTWTGTGTSTVVRIWLNCTGLPSAVDNWNGDTSPDITFTTDPGTPVNSGAQVGMGGAESLAGEMIFNDFLAGDL